MSRITDIIEKRKEQSPMNNRMSEFNDLLTALDTLADQLERIGTALETLAGIRPKEEHGEAIDEHRLGYGDHNTRTDTYKIS